MMQYEVYLADLNPVIGREQAGFRPVMIISNDYENMLDTVTILPITSRKEKRKIYPNEVFLATELEKPSILLCQQIRTISKKRLVKKVSIITSPALKQQILDTICLRFHEVSL